MGGQKTKKAIKYIYSILAMHNSSVLHPAITQNKNGGKNPTQTINYCPVLSTGILRKLLEKLKELKE